MNVSYRWLSEYVDVNNVSAKELAELLTRGGIEVDGVESRNKGVEKVVVGHVVSREKHPDADKLSVCKVDVGTGEMLQIVCGAKNVDEGQKVPVALVGANLPGDLHIKRAKLRGVESQGMICSAKELGLNDKLLPKEIQEGILVLPADTEIGADALKVLGIDDEVLELDLTPNRSDCLSMIGVAYEVGALVGSPVKPPDVTAGQAVSDKPVSDYVRVAIHAPDHCRYFGARLIENATIGPSPLWIQNRLMAAGIRPINNVVDITNFVMLEYGQPLHAYDADTLAGGGKTIEVRLAREGERLTTLDGSDRELQPHMLLITDGEKPVGIAGVMGGANSEVSPSTTRILLEAAHFSGGAVRRTSRELGLRSEASLRFEKEVNPEGVIPALERATALICRYAGGLAAEGRAEAEARKAEPQRIALSLDRINDYLGTQLTTLEVKTIFARLGFGVESSGASFEVHVPLRRGDITRDVDLIEEIARLYGYDNIPTTLVRGETTPGSLTRPQRIAREIRTVLTQSGLHEAVTYSLTHTDRVNQLPGLFGSSGTVRLSMPMSEERAVLRTCLLPNLAESAVHNRNRNVDDVALFEIGSVFLTDEDNLTTLPEERKTVSAIMTGSISEAHWIGKSRAADFYDLKGILEKLTSRLGIGEVEYVPAAPAGFHPGRTAELYATRDHARIKLGRIGQLHPELQAQWELGDTYAFELDFAALVEAAGDAGVYVPLPKYPAASRDIAVVVGTDVPAGALIETIRSASSDYLESVRVFDVYTGERLGAGKKSVALALVYRHAERTMTDEEVAEVHGRVTDALTERHGAELRK
ncbi:phenylalanine--tRNA ligase subunit beta [Paenibacillus alkalitolerans]|uniref:phenylalanine--tRNA ligase subunit beta n=1 Tax=Paenibacillus alkalitolerans TaxID=2799335 RepID=UPI0018F3E375|nr:phenylalanine--tRNA ligase subunit beta [Paenibacillus alkalitolerans]